MSPEGRDRQDFLQTKSFKLIKVGQDFNLVSDALKSFHILTEDNFEYLNGLPTRQRRFSELLSIIHTKVIDELAFNSFIIALLMTDNAKAVEELLGYSKEVLDEKYGINEFTKPGNLKIALTRTRRSSGWSCEIEPIKVLVSDSEDKSNASGSGLSGEGNSCGASGSNQFVLPFESRFLQDFEPIQYLDSGSFGDVFVAKSKIDGRSYAIKRILLSNRSKDRNRKLREVQALANLDHKNIVRYYYAWTEETPLGMLEENDPLWSQRQCLSSSEPEGSATQDSDSYIVFRSTDSGSEDPPSSSHRTYLYIVQELCTLKNAGDAQKKTLKNAGDAQKKTLKNWLVDNLGERNMGQVLRMFMQIVEAVEYIHFKEFIHRDLKPENIFLANANGTEGCGGGDEEITIKVGDFGLVAILIRDDGVGNSRSTTAEEKPETKLTALVGSIPYMAPELTLASRMDYNCKVDIYSLGVILLEMIVPFSTTDELTRQMNEWKVGGLNSRQALTQNYPDKPEEIRDKLAEMLSEDPKDRPEASDIKSWLTAYLRTLK